ncbi:UDP-N-acetylglucosamine--undecaprenyl-phosphate N-acetylglucosaminephosphotransferase [Shewanella frigidimarina]|uniref:Undecaprenyl-phosphate alpha-N-acetylglucosaminyl 1-phosphate transferase n=1 Tax=Shewanella frigidimarina TaxID=56812 RepID=A0A119D0U9_SHEFR|nr:UDP-N-acetylglucosamine--undecaprenyl-phosphate N-acetylglucosaminephosphotransferase [Shewanella frigidimarina]KVX03504.1 UDP-phosphate N-acetylglucosaminyl 1-phosphate transferase [Shewanella frigidimarina]
MDLLIPLICAFIITFMVIHWVIPIAEKVGLVDIPKGRKQHTGRVPLIGGFAIYFSILITSMLFIPSSKMLNVYLVSASWILFIGLLDDKYDIPVRYRLVSQVIVASMMIFGAGIYLTNLGDLLGFGIINLSFLGVFVTVLAVIGAINAFNMVDGIDGLAGMLSLTSFAGLAFLLSRAGSDWYLMSLMFIAALIAYLMFNLGWPTKILKKIFMGDAGSMLIGLTVVWLLVIGADSSLQAFRPVTALYLVAIPLMDMAAIMFRRINKGDSPFKPDTNHLHHIFMRAGFTQKQALIIISLFASVFTFIGVISEIYQIPEVIMFAGFLVAFACYSYAILHAWQILSWFRSQFYS